MGGDRDSLARGLALAIACGRIGIGVGAFALTRRALDGLGFDDPGPAAIALARLAGGRDIALGIHTLAARDDRERLREAAAMGAAVDAGDALAFALLARVPGQGTTALRNAPLAAAAALAGGWALSRL